MATWKWTNKEELENTRGRRKREVEVEFARSHKRFSGLGIYSKLQIRPSARFLLLGTTYRREDIFDSHLPMSQTTTPHTRSRPSTRPASTANPTPFTAPEPPQSALPSPETLDILPAFYEILNRTLPPVPGATSNPPGAFPGQQPLDINQLAGEVSAVRARIRRARREVEALPDVDRGVEEQEEEMAYLRGRIRQQVGVLEGLKGSGSG